MVTGIGAGAGACIFGELSHTTKKEVRTTVFSVFMGIRQIGLVIGETFISCPYSSLDLALALVISITLALALVISITLTLVHDLAIYL